jgi:CRISPR-associated protein (TIGR02710 family)
MEREASIFLVCTVGGSHEPVAAAITHWRPVRIRFVHSPQTKGDIDGKIVPEVRKRGFDLDPGRYDFFELPDAEDFSGCVDRLRELTLDVEQWVRRGEAFRAIVDFTGGTKCMSAALAVHAKRWPCLFSYVGGTARNKAGVGNVVSGAEKVVHSVNPWDALGYQAIEEFIVLFDQRAFAAAARVAEEAKKRVSRDYHKRELNVLEQLARAFDAWDRFNHRAAVCHLSNVKAGLNHLRAVLGAQGADRVRHRMEGWEDYLRELSKARVPSRQHILDLLANARRRQEEGRFDDAVARLYRAIEATAQLTLAETYGLDSTERVPLARVPEALRTRLEPRAEEGLVKLGLQDTYALLRAWGDALGEKFHQAGLSGRESPIAARNRSILAHGFDRMSDEICDRLWQVALKLTGTTEDALPGFPRLSDGL